MRNICVIDDDIPINGTVEVDGRECIGRYLLEKLLERSEWADPNLKELLRQLTTSDEWCPSAFVSPDIYLNAIDSGWPKPDVIVFDWEYRAATAGPGDLLLEVLKRSFAPIFIYTGVDRNGEVEASLRHPDFAAYVNRRVFLLKKEEGDSSQRLLQEATRLYGENFSFRVASHLRRASADSVETILIALGACHIDFVKEFLNEQETRDTDIKALIAEKIVAHVLDDRALFDELTHAGLDADKAGSLLTLIKAKFRDEIGTIDTGSWNLPAQTAPQDVSALQDMWSYRLYHHPSDQFVRKGDIIREKTTGSLFLVTTPDCHLGYFWKKNCGHLTLIPLWDIEGEAAKIKAVLEQGRDSAAVKKLIKDADTTSLTNLKPYPDGWFVLPYVNVQGTRVFLLGFAKAAVVVNVPWNIRADRLDFNHWNTFERVATLSEPFATPIIEHSLSAMMGRGTPDYPPKIKEDIKRRLKEMGNALYPPPTADPVPAPGPEK